MLMRPVKVAHSGPRLFVNTIAYSGGTPDFGKGKSDGRLTDNGTGDTTITLADPFQRAPIVFCTPEVGVGAGSIGNAVSSTVSTIRTKTNNSAGSGADGTTHVVAVGFDSGLSARIEQPKHNLVCNLSASVLNAFSVTGTGTAAITSGKFKAGLVDNGTGDYTLSYRSPLAAAPVVLATANGSTAAVANINTNTLSALNVRTYNASATLTDANFDAIVFGQYINALSTKHRKEIHCTQRLPRLEVFTITVTAGTPAITAGVGDATVVDNGTGDFTLTFTKPFARVPVCVATADGSRIVTNHTKSVSSLRINVFTDAGIASDPGFVNVFCLGYDTTDEF